MRPARSDSFRFNSNTIEKKKPRENSAVIIRTFGLYEKDSGY